MDRKPVSLKHFVFFFSISAIHLATILFSPVFSTIEQSTKILLMPSLIVVYFRLTRGYEGTQRKFVLAALFFSWLGDSALIFQSRNSDFFLIGLICFLLAHVFYIFSFHLTPSTGLTLLKRFPWMPIIFIAYGACIFKLIENGLGEMLLPVLLYMSVILVMGVVAFSRFGKVSGRSFREVMLGAVFFILSDSLLALNKFKEEFDYSSELIMFTYITAQFLIILGMIEEKRT